nr:hypothetical protein [Tanacetum cinerariifolium]
MRSTHTDNQTCMANTNMVHNISLAALHLNPYTTLAVLHLPDPSPGHAEEVESKAPNDPEEEATEKEERFCVDILKHMHETCPITKRQTYDMVSEKWKTMRPKVASFCGVYANTILTYTSGADEADYLQIAMIDYHVEYIVSFTLFHCYEEEDKEVEEVRRPRPMGRDQAKRKTKAGSVGSSASSFDVEAFAKMMANEESPICRPPPVTTSSPYMFVESLGLTGSGVTNSSDGRVVTRADRTTVPISTIFGRFKDMPVSSAEADFMAHTDADLRGRTRRASSVPINNRSRNFGISPAMSSGGSFPVVNHVYLCLDVGTRSSRHQIINFCPSNANVPNNGAIFLNSSTAVNIEVVEADPSPRTEFLPAYMDLGDCHYECRHCEGLLLIPIE